MRTHEVRGKTYEVLYTGRRGSHTLGLQTSASDEDLLHVLATHETFPQDNVDAMVLSEKDFMKQVLSCELEALEALFSRVYITSAFQETHKLLLDSVLERKRLSDAKLKFKLFRAVRNQYKLYLKYGREGDLARSRKHLAKVHLYLALVEGEEALTCFRVHKISQDLQEEYFAIRETITVEEAEALGVKYREAGTSKAYREARKQELEARIQALRD